MYDKDVKMILHTKEKTGPFKMAKKRKRSKCQSFFRRMKNRKGHYF